MAQRRVPSLNWMRVFEAAAQAESFSAAARLLNMTPSAVSQQIGALEHHLGTKLFIREARAVRLSEAGYQLLPSISQALSIIETNAESVSRRAEARLVTLQTDTIFATSWLAQRTGNFRERHPDVRLNVVCSDEALLFGQDAADVIVSFGPLPQHWTDRTNLFSETVFPVAVPAIAKTVRMPADLLNHDLIEVVGHRVAWSPVLSALDIVDVTDVRYALTNTTAMALSLAGCGQGIALARAPATDWLAGKLGLVACSGDVRVKGDGTYTMAVRPTGGDDTAIRNVTNWLIEQAKQS